MVKKDDIWSTLVGLVLGAVGIVVLSEVLKPKCPKCNNKIKRGTPTCQYCGTLLEWR
jgi:hypothetical protein